MGLTGQSVVKEAVNNTDDDVNGGDLAENSQFRVPTSTTGPQSGGPQSGSDGGASHVCTTCSRPFPTAIGLGVHISRAHPDQANDAIDTDRIKRRWNAEELRLMADHEARASIANVDNINQHLVTLMPERTLDAIKGKRRNVQYKRLVVDRIAILTNENLNAQESAADNSIPAMGEPEVVTDQPNLTHRELVRNALECSILDVEGIGTRSAMELVEIGKEVMLDQPMNDDRIMRWLSDRFKNSRKPKGPIYGMTTEYHGTNKQKRRQRYARVQSQYKKDVSAAARMILKENDLIPTKIPPTRHMLEYWKDVFATGGGRAINIDRVPTKPHMETLWYPVTIDEIKSARASNEKGAGPDGLRPLEWNMLDDRYKLLLYNIFIYYERVPLPIKGSRTVFTPKIEGGSLDPGDFRPLSICSVILREFNKILARRFISCYTYDERQTAYLPVDGVCINVSLLSAIIAEAKRLGKELHIAILDLVKAFNSMYHSALIEAITEAGCPKGFIKYIADMYNNVKTEMQFEGKSEMVRILAGVYQGDPLSGPLFTLAYEKALKALNDEVGFDITDVRVNASAYSDDGLLLAMTVIGLQNNLDKFGDTLAKIGLRINSRKSKTVSFVPSGRQKKMKIVSNKQFTVDGRRIDTLTISDFWKYLGVSYNTAGPEVAKVNLDDELSKVTKGPLKPQQRIHLLKTFVIPKHLNRLVLSRTTAVGLRKMDLMIRCYVRRWLHLPHDVPVAFMHAPVKAGGLGIPCMKQWIPLMRFSRLTKAQRTGGDRIAAVLSCQLFASIMHSCKQALAVLGCGEQPTQQGYHAYWRNELLRMVDGKDLKSAPNHPSATAFNSTRMNDISGEDYIHYNQLRSNSVPTRKRTARGRPNKPTTCRAGCRQVETLHHVIQGCIRSAGGLVLRHDRVVNILFDEFMRKGYAVEKEVHLRTSEELWKPDLVLKVDGRVTVVDAQVVQCGKLESDYRVKVSKYREAPELVDLIRQKYRVQEVDFEACTISYKGIWSSNSIEGLKSLGVSNFCLFKIVTSVLRGSWLNWVRFNNVNTVVHW